MPRKVSLPDALRRRLDQGRDRPAHCGAGVAGVYLRFTAPDKRRTIGDNLRLESIGKTSSLKCHNDSPSAADGTAYAAFERQIREHVQLAQKVGAPRIRFQITADLHLACPGPTTWSRRGAQ